MSVQAKTPSTLIRIVKGALLVSVAAVALSACASNRASGPVPDYSGLPVSQAHANLEALSERYQANPRDPNSAIHYSAALRAFGQSEQAVAVVEATLAAQPNHAGLNLAYAKALAAVGRFDQALNVADNILRPEAPDWNVLKVKGAVLDQMGRNEEARRLYTQALTIAPNEASLYANMGLSYAMTGNLQQAETQLRTALNKRGVTSPIRQNLALVLGLQGRFDEARSIYQADLPADQVEANMAYIRALLTQQNRWDLIQGSGEQNG